MKSFIQFLLVAMVLAPLSAFAVTVSGTVKMSTDTTVHVSGAKVVIIAAGVRTDSVVTDSVGNYAIPNVTTGNKTMQTSKAGYVTQTSGTFNLTVDVTRPTTNLVPVIVSGVVKYGADTTKFVAGVKVVLLIGTTRSDSSTTDSVGRYSIPRVVPGTVFLQIAAGGYFTKTDTVVVATASLTHNMILSPITVSGTVKNATDTTKHIAGAKVVLIAAAVRVDSAVTDASGNFTIYKVIAGTKTLQTTAAGFVLNNTANFVVGSANVTQTINMAVAGSITGTLKRASDSTTVIVGAFVMLRRTSATGAKQDSMFTDALGKYSFSNLAPGTPNYYVVITNAGFTNLTRGNIAVTAGTVKDSTNYMVTSPGVIRGTIKRSSDSSTVAAVVMTLRRGSATSDSIAGTTSNSSGVYTFANVATSIGNYWVTATGIGFTPVQIGNIVVPVADTAHINFALDVAPGSITGTVTGAGNPITGATVVLRLGSATAAISGTTTTGVGGTYSFNSVTPGNYWITASAGGYLAATNAAVFVPNGQGATSDFALAVAPGTITGTLNYVITVDLIQAIKNATVELRRGDSTSTAIATTTSNSSGVYTFSNVTAGAPNYWVKAITTVGTATNGNIVVTQGGGATSNFNFYPESINPGLYNLAGIRFFQSGNRLMIEMNVSKVARTVEVYDLSGIIHNRIDVPAGVSQVVVPANFVKGYFFQVK